MPSTPSSKPSLSVDRRRALALLAGSPDGTTEDALAAHGLTVGLLADLVRDGLATATAERVRVGKREIEVTRLRITDEGRLA
jgi:hypothetical protein